MLSVDDVYSQDADNNFLIFPITHGNDASYALSHTLRFYPMQMPINFQLYIGNKAVYIEEEKS